MSLTVISPTQLPSSSTTSSFSMRCWCSRRLASSWSTFSLTVTRFSRVISSETFWAGSEAKRTSRLVRMPTSRPAVGRRCRARPPECRRCCGASHQRQRVGERRVGADGDRVHHHAEFELLDLPHLLGLLGRREIAVDDADAAGLRHGDGQPRLGDGVHGGRQDRQVELDVAGDAGADIGLGRA